MTKREVRILKIEFELWDSGFRGVFHSTVCIQRQIKIESDKIANVIVKNLKIRRIK